MNMLKRELKANLKPFLFWMLGLLILDFAGMMKFTGMAESNGADVTKIFASFPKIVLAMFGMAGADISTLTGYFSIMSFFTMMLTCIYAISLGVSAVSRESFDKTYEFVFTKPRKRTYILFIKVMAGGIYLVAFCILNYFFSLGGIATLNLSESISTEVFFFTLANFIIGVLFFSIAIFLSAAFKESEKGSKYSNLVFICVFIVGVIYDTLDNPGGLVLLTPIKYFSPDKLIAHSFDIGLLALCLTLIVGFFALGFKLFEKKDLTAG